VPGMTMVAVTGLMLAEVAVAVPPPWNQPEA
jgi:hypothetical protein